MGVETRWSLPAVIFVLWPFYKWLNSDELPTFSREGLFPRALHGRAPKSTPELPIYLSEHHIFLRWVLMPLTPLNYPEGWLLGQTQAMHIPNKLGGTHLSTPQMANHFRMHATIHCRS
jgi:hypothetical protein